MRLDDWYSFREAFNVRRCEKCCGNCKHFEREWEDSGCNHPKLEDFDSDLKEIRKINPEFTETYGAYSGASVDEGNICDLWEKKNEEYN